MSEALIATGPARQGIATDTPSRDGSDGQRSSLHFTIFGLHRSGTSALRASANWHPHLFCLNEWDIGLSAAHSALQLPAAIFDRDDLKGSEAARVAHRDQLRKKLLRNADVVIGNKRPIYYKEFNALKASFPFAKNTAIYRSSLGFTQSWDRRANNVDDLDWHDGRTGLFGLFEWILFLNCLAAHQEVTIVSFDAVFSMSEEIYARWVTDVAGRQVTGRAMSMFRKHNFRAVPPDDVRAANCIYRDFVNRIGAPEIDAAVRRAGLAPASALASTLHTFVAERAQKIIEHIIDAVRRDDRPMVREFARRWSAQLRKVAAQQHWLYPEVTSSIANYAIAMRQMADA